MGYLKHPKLKTNFHRRNRMKKVLSLVLVIAMVLSSFSFAFAAQFEDAEEFGDYEKAIDTLAGLGIISGYEDGTFRPEKVVTRAEMAKLMVEVLGYGDLVTGAKSNFTDTQGHWADPWIAIAAGRNIVVGTGDGKFTPDRQVTYDEVLTMIVRGLGYTDDSNEIKSMSWPTNFKVKAAEIGITAGVVMNTTGADRGGVAQALYNALSATLVTVDNSGNITELKDENNKAKPLITRLAVGPVEIQVGPEHLNKDSKEYAGNVVDLEPYMYQKVEVYKNKIESKKNEVVYVKESNSLVVEGEVDKVDDNNKTINVKDASGKITKVSYNGINTSLPVYFNGEETDLPAVANFKTYFENTEYVKIVASEASNNSNGKIEVGEIDGFYVVAQTKAAKVEQEYVKGKTKFDVFNLPVDSNDDVDLTKVKVEGAVDSLEDIKVDDVVVAYEAKDANNDVIKTRLVVSRDTVEGKVTRVDTNDDRYIDGVKYTKNKVAVDLAALDLGDEGTFFLDHNGKIVAFEGDSVSYYAVVMGVEPGKASGKFGKASVKDYPQVKLATADDEQIVYDVYVKIDGTSKKITDSVTVGNTKIFVDPSATYNDGVSIGATGDVGATTFANLANKLVKYTVNKDNKITKITLEGAPGPFDKDSKNFVLASNVVIFNANDDYAVVSADRLKSDGTALFIARNKNGEIEAMVTGDVKAGSKAVYAYVEKANKAYDNSGDEVRLAVAYLQGKKVEYLTDDAAYFAVGTIRDVYALDLEGTTITGVTLWSAVNEDNDSTLDIDCVVTTATAISASTNSVTVSAATSIRGTSVAAGERFFLTEDATILEIESNGKPVGVRDIYDIKDREIRIYFDTENTNEVVFITYVK
jgi:hypothetical protein